MNSGHSVLESSRDKQKYVIKHREFHLTTNLKWFLCDLDDAIQGNTNIII